MSDWFESLKIFLTERFGNSLLFSYVVSWLPINYKAVLIVISGEELQRKLIMIDEIYRADVDQVHYFGLPLVAACVYTFIFPWITYGLLKYSLWQGRFVRAAKIAHEQATLITIEERDELISLHQQQVSELHAEMAKRLAFYNQQKTESDHLSKVVGELSDQLDEAKRSLVKSELDMQAIEEAADKRSGEIAELRGALFEDREVLSQLKKSQLWLMKQVGNVTAPLNAAQKLEQTHAVNALRSLELYEPRTVVVEFGEKSE